MACPAVFPAKAAIQILARLCRLRPEGYLPVGKRLTGARSFSILTIRSDHRETKVRSLANPPIRVVESVTSGRTSIRVHKERVSVSVSPPVGRAIHPHESEGESVRERIIAQAVALFCQKGYAATSVREIVEAARVTKPTLYYYFENKEDLFRHILTEGMEEFHSRLRAVYAKEEVPFAEKLEALAAVYFDIEPADYDYVRFIHAVAFSGLYHDVYDFQASQEAELAWVTALFREAQASGFLRGDLSAEAQASGFIGMCEMAMRNKIYGGHTEFAASLRPREITEIALQGMRGKRPPEK